MSERARVLRVSFTDPDEFRRGYNADLVNGGVFVATEETFELREPVEVDLVLEDLEMEVRLPGEVVHVVPPEVAGLGGTPGVAVQFSGDSQEVRRRMEPLARATGTFQYRPVDPGRRTAPRERVLVAARVADSETGTVIEGQTRNLSLSGALITVWGNIAALGKHVCLTLEHPESGEELEVPGVVVRRVEAEDGRVSALGIHFDSPGRRRRLVESFIDDVQSIEHSRRLGGISGPIAELGVRNLLQMFGQAAPAGTLVLRRGEQECVVSFESGLLRSVRLGGVSGVDALVRLLRWEQGIFEFFARVDSKAKGEPPLPLEAALLEASRRIDEGGLGELAPIAPGAQVCLADESWAGEGNPLTKVEEAVLDMARAGSFTVRRIAEVIPEPDSEIFQALWELAERGAIRFDD